MKERLLPLTSGLLRMTTILLKRRTFEKSVIYKQNTHLNTI